MPSKLSTYKKIYINKNSQGFSFFFFRSNSGFNSFIKSLSLYT